MTNETDNLLPKLRKVYDELGQDLKYFKTGLNFVKLLVEQGHSAESIACYLHLHCGFYVGHSATKDALIKNGIAA